MNKTEQIKEMAEDIAAASVKGLVSSKSLAEYLFAVHYRKVELDKLTVLSGEEVRNIVLRWVPIFEDSLRFAYRGDIREVARDFGFHIAGVQLSNTKREIGL